MKSKDLIRLATWNDQLVKINHEFSVADNGCNQKRCDQEEWSIGEDAEKAWFDKIYNVECVTRSDGNFLYRKSRSAYAVLFRLYNHC